MTADRRMNTEPRLRSEAAAGVRLDVRPAPEAGDPEADARFKQSIADLSRRLGERAARQATADPGTKVEAQRAAVRAYFTSRARLTMVLGTVAAAVAAATIAWLVVMIAAPDSPMPPVAARPVPPPDIETAAAIPPPEAQAPSPAQPSATPVAPVVAPVEAPAAPAAPLQPVVGTAPPAKATATDSASAVPAAAPPPAPLRLDEVREVQGRLRAFGFNPGPIDGTSGPRTQGAVMHYQQERGLPQTGQADRDLLEQLRRDPAPQVAVRPDPPRQAATHASRPRSSDPFAPLQAIGDSINRWFQSIGH